MSNSTLCTNFKQQTEANQEKLRSFSFIISVFIAVCLSAGFILSSLLNSHLSDLRIDERINPNKASVQSLARLPGIGAARARAIVTYRKNFTRGDSDLAVFQNCDDLQKVKGIGPKTAQNVEKWLWFE
jgi:competence ComEA-like helix-hairpin-helix protein